MIKLEGIYKSFDGMKLLRGVDFGVKKGESVALMGSSGSGKTVLLKIITGLIIPDYGRVIIGERELTRASRRLLYSIREDIGMIFQGSALFDSMTVRENIGFALKSMRGVTREEIGRRVREAMDQVKLGAVEELYPSQLSGGMKKRVGIARAIVARPELLLADEPTAGLDPATSRRIARLLRNIVEDSGMSCVMVCTSMEMAKIVTEKVAFLHEGRIATVVGHDELEGENAHEIMKKLFQTSHPDGGAEAN